MVSKRPKASRLQQDLARRMLRFLKDEQAGLGHHLVELELCRLFGVSRTPVRGALRLLAGDGVLMRQGRSYVLATLPSLPPEDSAATEDQEWHRLFQSLARARGDGEMADTFTQQEVVRRFSARLSSVMHVLRHLGELDLVERKPGNGWAFIPDPGRILSESYAFRRALEPQMLLQPGFRLDRGWAEKARGQHQKLRKAWRPGDGAAFHALNAEFHEQLARGSGNRAMLRAVQRHNELRQFLIGQWDYPMEQVHSAIDEHLEILAALEAGYIDKAAALMLHHLTQSASQSQKDEAA